MSQVHSHQAEQAEFVRKMQQVSLVLLSLYKDVEALISEKPACQSQDAQELMSQIAQCLAEHSIYGLDIDLDQI